MSRYQLQFLLLLLLTIRTFPLQAQLFGGNPPKIKWRQLKTDSVDIIYPVRFDTLAFRVAAVIERLQKTREYSLGGKLENIPVVLQTQTTNSNGYVGLGPYRSEFYLSTPMDAMELGGMDWTTTLTLHEYRHVIQYNNINRGIIRTVDWLLGDNARSLMSDMAVPNWFFEGDAVFNETIHSRQGRGRLPRFLNAYALLDKDGRHYNYQQLRNGSYKDYLPGHYQLGYLLVSYGYRRYGPAFWGKVIHEAASYKGIFYPFQKAIYSIAGISFKDFREAAFKEYIAHYQNLPWMVQGSKRQPNSSLRQLSHLSDKEVIDYLYPYPAILDGESGTIVLKNPRKSISRFVWLHKGKERNLGQAPISRNAYFGYNSGRVIYTRFQADPRWGYREYSDLEVLDIHSGKRLRLTHKRRFFTPDISSDGKMVAASELRANGHSAIVLLDGSGGILATWKAPKGIIYNYPKFFALNGDSSGALLFLIRDAAGRMGIGYVHLLHKKNKGGYGVSYPATATATDTIHPILSLSGQLLGFPVVRGDKLYYTRVTPGNTAVSPYTALMEINLTDIVKDTAVSPVMVGKSLRDVYQGYGINTGENIASLQTANGYGIFRWDGNLANSNDGQRDIATGIFDAHLPLTGHRLLDTWTDSITAGGFITYGHSVKKYPLLSHPFHFHSLQPNIDDPVYSLDLLGQNTLNTVQTKLSYSYNRVSQMSAVGGDLALGAWYLQPYVHMDYSWDHRAADRKGNQYFYKELTRQIGLQLPLNFTGGRWRRSLYLSTALSQSNLYWNEDMPASGPVLKKIRYLYSRLQLSVYGRQSIQQLYPGIGFYNYTEMNTPLDSKGARQWMSSATIYLPGLLPTHSLRWNLAYQHRDTAGAYGYNSRFPFSRGYVRPSYATMWKFGADYDLPVWYPDFGFAGLAYFFRIRANLYYDQSFGFDNTKRRNGFGSVGAALFADMNIGNQYPVTIGLRYNHLLNQDYREQNNWELILPIRLF